jgi:outer membrane PBP1 activator LpoA protein
MRGNVIPLFVATAILMNGCTSLHLLPDANEVTSHAAPPQTEEQALNKRSLLEAGALIRNGTTDKARTILGRIDRQHLPKDQQAQFALLSAQIELSDGNPEKALERLQGIAPQDLSPADRRTFHQARIFAHSLLGPPLVAAEERVALAPLLTEAKEQRDNQTAIWDILRHLPESALQADRHNTFGGWMALALLFKRYPPGSSNFDAALRQWQQHYPQHPADLNWLRNYSATLAGNFYPLQLIAVLLPETGPLAQAAQAVKAGFLAAENESRGERPKIRFYNSDANTPASLYRQAINDGAGLVIGPLEKEKLKNLAGSAPLSVPVLALNDIPGLSVPNLYQFSLSPLDEAEQAAIRARSDGLRNALILASNTDIGKRVAQGYTDAWRKYGGDVLKTEYFNLQSGNNAKRAIEKLLNFDESAARFRQISELVPNVQFAPRRRDDMDVIFISADPVSARALNQQLKNFGLGEVAVYATPHIYSYTPNPDQDVALDSITFCDIPWFFPGAYRDTIDAAALQAPWKGLQSIYLRLLAMGIDAYNLSSRLPQLDKETYHGATGNLLRLPDGRIRRNLYCSKFVHGVPEPLGFVDNPDNSGNLNRADGNVEENPRPTSP